MLRSSLLLNGQLDNKCCQLLHDLNHYLDRRELLIEDVGDYMPGSVMVQDFKTMKNVYMNRTGCVTLGYSSEELQAMGSDYFKQFFPQEEMMALGAALMKFVQEGDSTKTTSFFQRVRPDASREFKWYFTTSRLCDSAADEDTKGIMHISIEVKSVLTAYKRLSAIVDENTFVQSNYQKYCLLTKREKEIIKLIAEGASCCNISELLFISMHTVHNHRKNISRKIGTKTLSELIRFAVEFKLIR